MIDFEKERESFEAWQDSIGSNIAKRGLEYVNDRTASEWFSWRNRAALAQAEITELKQKLEKLESGEFVLVPRELNGNIIEDMWSTFDKRPDMQLIHNAMIEAVEKDHE